MARLRGESAGSTFALGAVYGFVGFCSGPILGAVLTVAASSGRTFQGAGMAAPLFLMALLWDRSDLGRRRLLRGREVALGKLRFHTTNLASGFMFVLLGVAFIAYEGTSALSGLYERGGASDLAFATERWANGLAGNAAAAPVPATPAVLLYRRSRSGRIGGVPGAAQGGAAEKRR